MVAEKKIVDLESLSRKILILKSEGKKIVLCHGTFDLLHIGHHRYLKKARSFGDILVVTLTADSYVKKGPGRPVFQQDLRAEVLANLEIVDYVSCVESVTAVPAIEAVKPDFYVKGIEYKNTSEDVTGNINIESKTVEKYGGDIVFTDDITFSSSSLLNQHFGGISQEVKNFMSSFKRSYSIEDIFSCLDSLRKLRVAVVGDAIIDQYHYVNALGQTGKGNVLAVQYDSEEQFIGGSLAVANHVAQHTSNVTVATVLGRQNSFENFISATLDRRVECFFDYFVDAPTVTKRRFVDSDLNKYFEVYYYNPNAKVEDRGKRLLDWARKKSGSYDLVIVTDFGNGMINGELIDELQKNAKYLAVNTQLNSGNRGFHTINKYSRADFVSLNEPELRVALHDRSSKLSDLCEVVANRINASRIAITKGSKGVHLLDVDAGEHIEVPALSSKVVDRIGAGDAFLSLAAMTSVSGASGGLAALLGSIAGALDVQIVCNREPVSIVDVKKFATTLLK